ncbi:MAG: phosphoribosylglycinamide formyltransferase [Alphaproteobacteria bacterium CG_4_10_14_0_2_um_filter_63_37]|nr:MAG: phosphoribosylglycinamide formyltransferase [Proteobacteria bacterium CG1_02_64_396]PJA25834.1 MAG: phosphoribosylglycinamide formyltransferase [Alphaproteobacteria bacterium CG_4_10_14_0_2_um_filter_63_37]
MASDRARLGILISGNGTNMQAIVAACRSGAIAGQPALILSNRAEAPGVAWAREQGLPVQVLAGSAYSDRRSYDDQLVKLLQDAGVGTVCLAGYMRLVTPVLLDAFPGNVLNIHPSLLPSFKGLDAIGQAWRHGVQVAGVTVHYVDEEMDSGPIIAQAALSVDPADTLETLTARMHQLEHRIYPGAVAAHVAGRLVIEGRRVRQIERR